MTERELYDLYSSWTGQLHFWCLKELGRHLDCEYFPSDYLFRVYSGYAEEALSAGGLPGLARPLDERRETVRLYRPADHFTRQDLDRKFKEICLAASRVLEIGVARAGLPPADSALEPSKEGTKQAKHGRKKALGPHDGHLHLPAPAGDPPGD